MVLETLHSCDGKDVHTLDVFQMLMKQFAHGLAGGAGNRHRKGPFDLKRPETWLSLVFTRYLGPFLAIFGRFCTSDAQPRVAAT